jgi:hypothetical protein
MVCDKPNAVCVGCLGDSDCAEAQHCFETVCVADLCHSGETACVDGTTRKVCKDDGAGWTLEACVGSTVCVGGNCTPAICTPGVKACAEGQNAIVTCNATGTGWGQAAACPAATTCKDAGCRSQVCTPGKKTCNAQGAMEVCAADGLDLTTWYCPAARDGKPQVCVPEAAGAVCKAQACVPGASFCEGQVAKQCDALGLQATVKADCSQPDGSGKAQVCLDGACQSAACTAGTTLCADATTLAMCMASGLGYGKTPCGQGNGCDDGACGPLVCTPGQASCEGGKAVKCAVGGTKNVLVEDCAGKGKVCVGGVCVAKVCTPGIVQCQGGAVGTCKPDGTGWTLQACPEGEVCASGKCETKVCDAGATGCQGKSVAVCNASGTAWKSLQDCAQGGQTCLDGKCVAASCTAGQVACDGKVVVACNASGTGWTSGEDCGKTGQVCLQGKCVPPVCSPGALKCEGSKVLTCNVGATGWEATKDCASDGLVCAEGKCLVCSPGAKSCTAEGKEKACLQDGSTWVEKGCDDGNACTSDGCQADGCTSAPFPGQSMCSSNGAAWCAAGNCVTGALESCKAILSAAGPVADGQYWLDPDGNGPVAAFLAWCDMSANGGGWTLAMRFKNDGKLEYQNPLWTTPTVFDEDVAQSLAPGLNMNAKFKAFEHVKGTELMGCKGTPSTGACLSQQFVSTTTLLSVFSDGFKPSLLSRADFVKVWGDNPKQTACNQAGLNNAVTAYGSTLYAGARFGLLGNNEPDCLSPDAAWGFGLNAFGAPIMCGAGMVSGYILVSSNCTQGTLWVR